jgi:excisionase family DNA binding protein
VETKQRTWLTAKEAAEYLGINYPRFTRLANQGVVPRSLVPGTIRTYRYNVDVLDQWMLENQERQ